MKTIQKISESLQTICANTCEAVELMRALVVVMHEVVVELRQAPPPVQPGKKDK